MIGKIEDGTKIAIGVVLNTSRWINAIGSIACISRAYIEASTYSQTRKAFG